MCRPAENNGFWYHSFWNYIMIRFKFLMILCLFFFFPETFPFFGGKFIILNISVRKILKSNLYSVYALKTDTKQIYKQLQLIKGIGMKQWGIFISCGTYFNWTWCLFCCWYWISSVNQLYSNWWRLAVYIEAYVILKTFSR